MAAFWRAAELEREVVGGESIEREREKRKQALSTA